MFFRFEKRFWQLILQISRCFSICYLQCSSNWRLQYLDMCVRQLITESVDQHTYWLDIGHNWFIKNQCNCSLLWFSSVISRNCNVTYLNLDEVSLGEEYESAISHDIRNGAVDYVTHYFSLPFYFVLMDIYDLFYRKRLSVFNFFQYWLQLWWIYYIMKV